MSRVRNTPAYSLASLVIDPDDYIYLRQIKSILEKSPTPKQPPPSPTQLVKHIYMGSLKNADDVFALQGLGITHVLNCAGTRNFDLTKSPYPPDSGILGYLLIPAEDHAEYDIMRHFQEAFSFLDRCKKSGGKAFIHCNLGINRSGAICAAYLMVDQHMPLLEVLSLLKQRRGLVLANKGFRRQLVRFARARGLLDVPQYLPQSCSLKFGTDRTNTINLSQCENGLSDGTSDMKNDYFNCNNGSEQDHFILNGYGADSTPGYNSKSSTVLHYGTLPRNASNGYINYHGNKRHVAASHYDNEYFMDTIPEDHTHGHSGRSASCLNKASRDLSNSRSSSPRSLSKFGAKSVLGFQKSRGKGISDSGSDSNLEALSTTRPLRVYKRSVTDTELYQKPSITHTYKRADTVATSDIWSGLERISLSDKASSMPSGLSHQHRASSRLSISSSIFNRFRSDSKKSAYS